MLKIAKPVTPSQRQLIKLNSQVSKKKSLLKREIKSLKKNSAGRNNFGKITIKNRGGGHKKKYRKIQFSRCNTDTGIICSIEYDPYRKANIASVFDLSLNSFFYILAPQELQVGDIIKSGKNADISIGNCLPLWKMPTGSYIHNVFFTKKKNSGQVSRAAGTYSQIIETTSGFVKIKVSSGTQKFFSLNSYATIGIISNELVCLTQIGKAGRSRWLNKRPRVRGVA